MAGIFNKNKEKEIKDDVKVGGNTEILPPKNSISNSKNEDYDEFDNENGFITEEEIWKSKKNKWMYINFKKMFIKKISDDFAVKYRFIDFIMWGWFRFFRWNLKAFIIIEILSKLNYKFVDTYVNYIYQWKPFYSSTKLEWSPTIMKMLWVNKAEYNLDEIKKYIFKYYISDFDNRMIPLYINWEKNSYVFVKTINIDLLNRIWMYRKIISKTKDVKMDIIILTEEQFNDLYAFIVDYNRNKLILVNELKDENFKKFIVNSIINKDIGDFHMYYDEWKDFWYMSARHKRKYKLFYNDKIVVEDLFDDILTLWGKFDWAITDLALNIWNVKYRCSVVNLKSRVMISMRRTTQFLYDPSTLKKYWVDEVPEIKFYNERIDTKWFFPMEKMYKKDDLYRIMLYLLKNQWFFYITWKTNSWKSTSLQAMMNYVVSNWLTNGENKKIVFLENPIEEEYYDFCQLEVDDSDWWEEYGQILKALKRQDPDFWVVWEMRSSDIFSKATELSSAFPVALSFHSANISQTLSNIDKYCKDTNLYTYTIMRLTNFIISQSLVNIEKETDYCELSNYIYKDEDVTYEFDSLVKQIWEQPEDDKWNVNPDYKELMDIFQKIKETKKDFKILRINRNYDTWLVYEMCTNDEITKMLKAVDGDFSQVDMIYDFLQVESTIFYQIISLYFDWKISTDTFGKYDIKAYSLPMTKKILYYYLRKITP